MNILVVAHYQGDGAATAIFIESQIAAYVQQGHAVRVIVPIALGKQGYRGERFSSMVSVETIEGAPHAFVRYLSLSKYGVSGFNTKRALGSIKRHLSKILEGFKPDIIHAHTLGFDSEIGAWLKEQLHCPLVVTTHGSDSTIPMERGESAQMKTFCDKADCVVAVSTALANRLRPCGTTTPIGVILNGFDVAHIVPDRGEEAALIQVSSLQKQKRPEVTLRAFATLKRTCPDACLTFVGDGVERKHLELLCEELGIAESVRFLGHIPNPDVLAEMGKARFFVMPSVREGFGIVYIEAMASGCITIGTKGEGVADLIRSGENGFLVPPDDPDAIVQVIRQCLADPDRAAAIADQGQKDVQRLTWEENAKKYIALFQSLEE